MSGISDRNPFVGPRPIQQGEALYGRTEEVRELYNRLQARRIVVLHSPSGAGKSSLVQAGLIPKLKEGKFDVWKPIRVNLDPRGLPGIPEGTNRYLLSAMVSLEEELPAERRRSPRELAGLDFLAYLEGRPRRKGRVDRSVVLIFDQFEEVLTTAPRAVEGKRDFFSAVGKALDTGDYWALFIVREDYLAAFAPYRDRIPTQMSNTFRLDLLGLSGAREAAEQPALKRGRTFPGVDKLIRDLSTVQVQQPDGTFVAEQGLHVEPVQLQVVCRRLWEAMPEDDLSIDESDIAEYAEVSKALAGYYAESVKKIGGGDRAVERSIREWVGSKLIVGGIRSQVRQEAGQSGGLDNTVIDGLLGSYLVRTEQRAGANWFELSHDRLVEPVQLDNEAWEQANLHPLQVQAKLWESGRRAQALLLSAEALSGATSWADENTALLTEGEEEFLALSRKLREDEAGQRRRQRMFLGVIAAVGGVALIAAVLSFVQYRKAEAAAVEAEKATRSAEAEAERARTASVMAGARELLARGQVGTASILVSGLKDPEGARGWLQLATDILVQGMPMFTLPHQGAVHFATWSPDGKHIVTASDDKTARVWNADGTGDPIILKGHEAAVRSAVWSPDGKRIVTASDDKTARIWNADGKGAPLVLKGSETTVDFASWSPDGKRIVTASFRTVRVWNADGTGAPILLKINEDKVLGIALEQNGKRVVVKSPKSLVLSVAWSPDGTRIVTASSGNTVRVWNADGSGIHIVMKGQEGEVAYSATWSPDGTRIVTASSDKTARVWNSDGTGDPIVFKGHEDKVHSAVWSPDGKRIITASEDRTARIWNSDGKGDPIVLRGHKGAIHSASWSPDGKRIVTSSSDSTACVWSTEPLVLKDHKDWVTSATWSSDGMRIVTASNDKTARVWNADGKGDLVLRGHEDAVCSATWSPDGMRIVTAFNDKTARVWNAYGKGDPIVFKGHEDKVHSAVWSPDGKRIVTASSDKTARVWSSDGKGDPLVLKDHETTVDFASWSPDGKRIVTLSGSTARIWNADGTGAPLVLKGHEEEILSVSWSPDGKYIVTASGDKTARVWNSDGKGDPAVFKGHKEWVTSATWSPDGKRIVTTSKDKTARVWSSDGTSDPIVLKGHEEPVRSAVWSPDGKRIVTASEDKTARIWNSDGTGAPILIKGHQAFVQSAVWSPDGKRIVTLSGSTARVWHLAVPALQQALRDATLDCLTPDQRQTYLTEGEPEARKGHEACERSHGRTPFFADVR